MLINNQPVGVSVGLQESTLLFVLNKRITLGKSCDQVSNQTDLSDVSIPGKDLFYLLFCCLKIEPCYKQGEVRISCNSLVGYVACQHSPPYGTVVGLFIRAINAAGFEGVVLLCYGGPVVHRLGGKKTHIAQTHRCLRK